MRTSRLMRLGEKVLTIKDSCGKRKFLRNISACYSRRRISVMFGRAYRGGLHQQSLYAE